MGREILLRPERCVLCMACEVACAREHEGQQSIWVIPHNGHGAPISCRHCQRAPCVAVCPPKVLEQRNGSVYLAVEKCTGCELCVWACPFGAMALLEGRAHKCDLCLSRREEGRDPACVLTCPSQALVLECVADFVSHRRDIAGRAWATGWTRRGQ